MQNTAIGLLGGLLCLSLTYFSEQAVWVILASAGLVLVLGVTWWWPEATVAVLFGGMFLWELVPEALVGFRVLATLAWVLLAYLVNAYIRDRQGFAFRFTSLDRAMFAFSAFMAVSLGWSSNQKYGVWKLTLFVALSVLPAWFLRCWYSVRPQRLRRLAQALALAGVVPLFCVAWTSIEVGGANGVLLGASLYSQRRIQFDKLFNVYGASESLLATGIASAYFGLTAKSLVARSAWTVFLVAHAWAILLLGQRTEFMVLLCACFVLRLGVRTPSVRKPRLRPREILRLSITISVLATAVWAQLTFNYRASLSYLQTDYSITNRIVALQIALHAFLENPLGGTGCGDYVRYADAASAETHAESSEVGGKLYTDMKRAFPHNILFEVLAELGLIGRLLWALVLRHLIAMLTIAWRNPGAYALGVLGVALLAARIIVGMVSADLAGLSLAPAMVFGCAAIRTRVTDKGQRRCPSGTAALRRYDTLLRS